MPRKRRSSVHKLTADTITDTQIRTLREALFATDARQPHVVARGLVACWAGLGRSHRRSKARAHCAELLNAMALGGWSV
jgi:hypothetical protein